jgi:hypothetical protein
MIKNVLLYWPRFIREAWYTRKYYKAVKSIEEELNEKGLRVDWIGRIYGVVALKDEFLKQPEVLQQSYVFQQLGDANKILIKYGLSNDAFPEIQKLDQENYLVILYPENDNFNIYAFVRNILFLITITIIGYGLFSTVKYLM